MPSEEDGNCDNDNDNDDDDGDGENDDGDYSDEDTANENVDSDGGNVDKDDDGGNDDEGGDGEESGLPGFDFLSGKSVLEVLFCVLICVFLSVSVYHISSCLFIAGLFIRFLSEYFCLSLPLFVVLVIRLSFYCWTVSFALFVYICVSVCLLTSITLPVCLSACLSVCLSVSLLLLSPFKFTLEVKDPLLNNNTFKPLWSVENT